MSSPYPTAGRLLSSLSFDDYSLKLAVSYFPAYSPANFCFAVNFYDVVAWQVVNESFTTAESIDVQSDETGLLRIFKESPFLSWIKSRYPLYETAGGTAIHYRLWTETKIIDVVSCMSPEIEPVVA